MILPSSRGKILPCDTLCNMHYPFYCSSGRLPNAAGAGSPHILQKRAFDLFMCPQGHARNALDTFVAGGFGFAALGIRFGLGGAPKAVILSSGCGRGILADCATVLLYSGIGVKGVAGRICEGVGPLLFFPRCSATRNRRNTSRTSTTNTIIVPIIA